MAFALVDEVFNFSQYPRGRVVPFGGVEFQRAYSACFFSLHDSELGYE